MQLRGLHSCKLVTSCIYNHFEVKSICILVKVLLLFKICSGADKCYNRTLCNEFQRRKYLIVERIRRIDMTLMGMSARLNAW
jgi:hypothetical protein